MVEGYIQEKYSFFYKLNLKNSKSSHSAFLEEGEHVNFYQSLGTCRLMMCKNY